MRNEPCYHIKRQLIEIFNRKALVVNTTFIWLGSFIAIFLYYPLVSGILQGKIEQSFATWILWVSLDLIALISIILQSGNYLLLVVYCAGGTIVIISLVYKKQFKWTRFETFILFLVIACLIIWAISGSKMVTISSTLAVVISGIPQFAESWKKPDLQTSYIYAGCVLANGFSFLGGKSWSIEERFYPGACAILCFCIAMTILRKKEQTAIVTAN